MEPEYGHLVGTQCPGFTVRDTHGDAVGPADFIGSPALILFFPFAFTPICEAELTDLDARLADFDDVALLAISCDSVASLRAWQEDQDLGFELGSDFWPHGEAAQSFGVFDEVTGHPLRASFVLDPEGRVAWSVINPAGMGRPVQPYLDALAPLRTGPVPGERP